MVRTFGKVLINDQPDMQVLQRTKYYQILDANKRIRIKNEGRMPFIFYSSISTVMWSVP